MLVKRMLCALPLTALGMAAFFPAHAEEPLRAGEVHVSATRVEKELQDVPMSVTVLTSKDVEKSAARTIGELLQDVPGVRIENDGSQGLKRVSIRGEDAFRTLVLIDGQKISEPLSASERLCTSGRRLADDRRLYDVYGYRRSGKMVGDSRAGRFAGAAAYLR